VVKPLLALVVGLSLITYPAIAGDSGVPGDLNGSGNVDFADFLLMSKGIQSGSALCDLNGDDRVDDKDFVLFSRIYGSDGAGDRSRAHKFAPGKAGVAHLILRERSKGRSTPTVTVGDTLEVELFMEARGASVTQVEVILSLDDAYLQVVRANPRGDIIRPFLAGGFLSGQVEVNDTQGDLVGDSDANQIPLFQLHYSELIANFQGIPQRVAVGNGVVARFKARVIGAPSVGVTPILIDVISPTGAETGYFIVSDPGAVYNFARMTSMEVTVLPDPDTPVLDLDRLGTEIVLARGDRLSLDLSEALVSGPSERIVWTAVVGAEIAIASVDGSTLTVIGNQVGQAELEVTATDVQTGEPQRVSFHLEVQRGVLTKHQAVVAAAITRAGVSVPGLILKIGRSVSGREIQYKWSGETDGEGRATIDIQVESDAQFWRVGASGYYRAIAVDALSGEVVGEWGSLPISGGAENDLTLRID
jgi:hypothetical protein